MRSDPRTMTMYIAWHCTLMQLIVNSSYYVCLGSISQSKWPSCAGLDRHIPRQCPKTQLGHDKLFLARVLDLYRLSIDSPMHAQRQQDYAEAKPKLFIRFVMMSAAAQKKNYNVKVLKKVGSNMSYRPTSKK